MDKSKIIISVNSFMPTGFIGWSELAIGLLQKYSCKILTPINFSKKEELLQYFDGKDHQLNDGDFIDRIDHTDSEITFLALEPASEEIIPSMFSGKVFGAICGAGSRNWEKQIQILQKRNVKGFLSEVLPDELSSRVSNKDLEYFCTKALFLPPCLGNGKSSKSNPTYETVIIKESDEGSGNPTNSGSKLKRVLPILEQMEGFQTIDFSHDTDFSVINEECNKSKAVYNLLHYPQLTLFFKINRSAQDILNKEHPFDSPLRNFLADYSLFEFESIDKLKQPSARAQTLELLSKNKVHRQEGISQEVLTQFGASALLPKLEQRLGIGDVHNQGDRLDYLHKVTTWESLKKSNVHLKEFPHIKAATKENGIYVDSFLHPAGSSGLLALLKEKNEYAGSVFFNTAFAGKILSLPNSSSTTHLFIELLEYDPKKWMDTCEKAISSSNALRLAELLYFSCLLAKDESTQKERILLATVFYDKLLRKSLSSHHKANAFKAKLKLLNPKNKLSTEDFPAWEDQLQAYAQAVYEVNQQELFMPSFRSDAQEFLGQFIELFFQSPSNTEPSSHAWVILFLTSGRLEEGTKMIRNLIGSGKTPVARVLHYLCVCYFTSSDPRKVLQLVEEFEKELLCMKTFDFWSRLFMLLISSLKLDTDTVHSMIEELLTEHKHISSITPIPISSFLVFLHVGKALQSAEVQDKALRQGNNHFFTFINTMDFGKVDLIRSGNCPSMIGKLTEFIQD